MPETIHPTRPSPNILLLQRKLQATGYGRDIRVNGYPDAELWSSVEMFQLQHIGPHGVPLVADGIVGPATWWALDNPHGVGQKNGYGLAIPARSHLSHPRLKTLDRIVAEYRKDVRELPWGSNRSPQIDTYWGKTGIIGEPWCCAWVSQMLLEALGGYPLGSHHVRVLELYQEALRRRCVVTAPRPLHVFVQLKSSGKGHTGFVTAVDSARQVVATLEGNCGNRLKHGRRLISTIDAWVDPFQDRLGEILQELPELEQLGAATTR